MTSDTNSRSTSILRRVLDDPEQSISRLPVLLEWLEHEELSVRIKAVAALCLLADAHPDSARVMYERCADRQSFAATWARRWLFHHHGDGWDTPEDTERPREENTPTLSVVSGKRSRRTGDDTAVVPDAPDDRRESERATHGTETRHDGTSRDVDSRERPRRVDRQNRDARSDRRRRRNTDSAQWGRDAVVEDGEFAVGADVTDIDSFQFIEPVTHHDYLNVYKGIGHVRGEYRSLLIRAYTPPATASASQFGTACSDAITRWAEIDTTPGITTVFDWGTQPAPWVITSYGAETLWTVGRLSPETAYRAGLQLATAIASAHENGVTHGGLSPHTVLFDRGGSTLDVSVTDVGICRALQNAGCLLPLHRSYVAPEMVEDGYGTVDWMTDIYQLGLVLYSMFTGKTPRERPGIDNPVGPDPTDVVDELPPQTDRIVKKATATHKISRYESIQELIRDLQTTLERQ